MGLVKKTAIFALGIGLLGQIIVKDRSEQLSLEDILRLTTIKGVKRTIGKEIDTVITRINNQNNSGDFMDIKLPPELIPAKEFWKNMYQKYNFDDVIFYNPKTYQVHAIHQSVGREVYFDMTRNQKKKIRDELKKIERAVEREVKADVGYSRGAADMLATGTENILFYSNECEEATAEVGVNPIMGSAIGLGESCMQNLVSRSFAVGFYQFLKKVAIELGMIVDYSIDQRLDPRISAHYTALSLKEYYARYVNPQIAATTHYAGPNNSDKAFVYTNFVIEQRGIEEPLSQEEFFSIIVNDFAYQPNKIRGTFRKNSRHYLAIICALMEIRKERYSPELLKNFEPEYASIKLSYKNPREKLNIKEVLEKKIRRELLKKELMLGRSLSQQEKERIQEQEKKELFKLNLSSLYLQKINGNTKFLRSYMGSRIKWITPQMTEGAIIRVSLEDKDWFMNKYGRLFDNPEIKIHKKEDKTIIGKAPFSLGELLYKGIMQIRKKSKHGEVTEEMLKMVEQSYLYDLKRELLTQLQKTYLENALTVVRMDIKKTIREKKAEYWSKRIPKYIKTVEKQVGVDKDR
ncbi:transglycosylase SLT domain-containing protein [Candidatus Woesearchaeota archaeon]|nr:transglycosylase SLT domain-containing protein [Candidatus Woesearchaeota archaeon]